MEIQQQLSELLGTEVKRLRKTCDAPARVSVIDVFSAVTNKSAQYAAKQLRNVVDKYPDVCQNMTHVKFIDDRGQNGTVRRRGLRRSSDPTVWAITAKVNPS